MTALDYEAMSLKDLRSHIIAHPNDEEAFQIFLNRWRETPRLQFPAGGDAREQIEEVLRHKARKSTGLPDGMENI
jgi:hypothetical protein